jgi:uracil-DNA glycosylase
MALLDQLNEDWQTVLADEFKKPYWGKLDAFVAEERATKTVYPSEEDTFSALNAATYDQIKVLLLGQDPYHGPNQAHGMSFSVLPGEAKPPSLVNIFKELEADLGIKAPKHGYLQGWADQGVLMLNAVLTVRQREPNSHQKQGWEDFTDAIIKKVSARQDPVIFLLWGGPAKKKTKLIDTKRHVVIESAHPSPLSAHNGFFGSKPFSKINAALAELGKDPIDWKLKEL